jgi:predicted hydrocarbon binding protein
MAKAHLAAIENLAINLERFAGKKAREKVLEENENLATVRDPKQIAIWVQGAMRRLDRAVDKKTRARVMEECGYACAAAHRKTIDRVIAKRKKYKSLEEFLEREKNKLLPGMRLERKGQSLYQYYMPQSFRYPMRCFCSLLRELPPEETVSATYCQCSKGFVQKMWEPILGRPIKVEILETAVSGAKECKFKVSL